MPAAPAPSQVAEVVVVQPLDTPLSYAVPPHLEARLEPGHQVRVPLGGRQTTGFVVRVRPAGGAEPGLRPIQELAAPEPLLTPSTLELGLWVARHYGCAPGEALQAVLPAPVRRARGTRSDLRVLVPSREAVARALDEHAEHPGWVPRLAVLRALEASPVSPTVRELAAAAGTSASPVHTLARQGLLRLEPVPAVPRVFTGLVPDTERPGVLTGAQQEALEGLLPRVRTGQGGTALLHGVTGSGKTEVYLRLLEAVLAQGRGGVLLVPEIALTPQTVERLVGRLGDVAVLHSGLSGGDRARQWRRLRSGEVRVAVGPRSAIFAPLPDLGLVVIDEEHETTFKQQSSPRYHAREVARQRCDREGALLVLGTATPSLEAEVLCRDGQALRWSLPERVAGRPLPACSVVDMRHQKGGGALRILSRPLVLALEETLHRGEQALLFLNRRGFSTSVLCRSCGWVASCRLCDINLTHYRGSQRLLCHYCGHEEDPPEACPDCLAPGVHFQGVGTERVAAAARMLFPGARVARMDGETLRRRGAAASIFRDLKERRVDVLVGTQVVAKGLDLPGLSLVGVVSADTALLVPDFRSPERTFQLLCQVAGRAGRGRTPGRVIIQTYIPDHPAVRFAAVHDHRGFAAAELEQRQRAGYPPYGHLLRLVVESSRPERGRAWAEGLAATLGGRQEVTAGALTVLGPAPCPVAVIKGSHRHHLLLRSEKAETLTAVLPELPRRPPGGMRLLIDRDPVSLM